jgi:YVTN family beta-propeller protein
MKLIITLVAFVFASLDISCAQAQQSNLPLRKVLDVPLTGAASRLDYQSFDAESGRLYIAHLGDDMMTVFDTRTQKVVGDVKDLKRVHGVLAVPELHRVYASATGTNELAVIDDRTLQIVARIPAGDYPDGIAYAGKEKKLYVSDKQGKTDTVIDAQTNKVVTTIALNAPAGNTQYDSISDRIFVAVHKLDQIIEIDPNTDKVTGNYPLAGCADSHGLLIDEKNRFAFAACEGNGKLAMFDLTKKKLLAIYLVGDDPDVLAFDSDLGRLYVSAESGVLTVFDEKKDGLETVGKGFYAAGAHTIAVDGATHRVYLPLENIDGKPILRIALPSDRKSK